MQIVIYEKKKKKKKKKDNYHQIIVCWIYPEGGKGYFSMYYNDSFLSPSFFFSDTLTK